MFGLRVHLCGVLFCVGTSFDVPVWLGGSSLLFHPSDETWDRWSWSQETRKPDRWETYEITSVVDGSDGCVMPAISRAFGPTGSVGIVQKPCMLKWKPTKG